MRRPDWRRMQYGVWIPDYRGAGRPPRVSAPIEHADFLAKAEVRRRYWARATVGLDSL